MQTFRLNEYIIAEAIARGSTRLQATLPQDVRFFLEQNESFGIEIDRPLSGNVVRDAIVTYYAKLIENERPGADGTFVYDASVAPVLTVLKVFRVDGELALERPRGKDAKGRDIVTVDMLICQKRAEWFASLPSAMRAIASPAPVNAWGAAQDIRAERAVPAIDAPKVETPQITDGQFSRLVFEPMLANRVVVETLEPMEPITVQTADEMAATYR